VNPLPGRREWIIRNKRHIRNNELMKGGPFNFQSGIYWPSWIAQIDHLVSPPLEPQMIEPLGASGIETGPVSTVFVGKVSSIILNHPARQDPNLLICEYFLEHVLVNGLESPR
jgi:hypothetical protein